MKWIMISLCMKKLEVEESEEDVGEVELDWKKGLLLKLAVLREYLPPTRRM